MSKCAKTNHNLLEGESKNMNESKSRKVDLIFYLLTICDMQDGRICDMTKEDMNYMWWEDDLDEIIPLVQDYCCKFKRESRAI